MRQGLYELFIKYFLQGNYMIIDFPLEVIIVLSNPIGQIKYGDLRRKLKSHID